MIKLHYYKSVPVNGEGDDCFTDQYGYSEVFNCVEEMNEWLENNTGCGVEYTEQLDFSGLTPISRDSVEKTNSIIAYIESQNLSATITIQVESGAPLEYRRIAGWGWFIVNSKIIEPDEGLHDISRITPMTYEGK